MYFWNTGALAGELQKETVTDSEQVKYLLASVLLYMAAEYASSWVPSEFNTWTVLDAVTSLAATLIGVLVCAKANREGDNKNFLSRIVCLGWPIGIRLTVLMITTYIAFDLILRLFGLHTDADKYQQKWYDVVISAVFSVLMIWRLRIWIRVASGQNQSA